MSKPITTINGEEQLEMFMRNFRTMLLVVGFKEVQLYPMFFMYLEQKKFVIKNVRKPVIVDMAVEQLILGGKIEE